MTADHHRRSVAVFSLLVVLLILAIVAAVGVSLLILSNRFTSVASPWVSPLSTIKAGAIDPALALGPLADIPDDVVSEQALAAGSADTALATLYYSTSLDDQTRTAGLLSVAMRFADAGQRDRAAQAAATAADVAILSPTMPDYSRATALAQASQILARSGKRSQAVRVLSDAGVIDRKSVV